MVLGNDATWIPGGQHRRWHGICVNHDADEDVIATALILATKGESDMDAKSLIGMSVFSIEGGRNVGNVERLLFSPEEMRVTALVVTPALGMMDDPAPQKVLNTEQVKAIGQDAVTVESDTLLDIAADGELPAGSVAFDQVEKERVITESGDHIGELSSLNFSEEDFRLDYIEVSRGFLSGSNLITVDNVVSVGEDVIVVNDRALDPMDEDVVGVADDELIEEDGVVTEDPDDDGKEKTTIFR